MIDVQKTDTFVGWLRSLADPIARKAIAARLVRLEGGNFGDAEPVGSGVIELRVHVGAGYRVYCVRQSAEVVVLLCGGDKRTQKRDIEKAIAMAKELRN